MCCFSRPVRFVAGTKIFARGLDDGRQVLAYSMNVELDEAVAMVLPLPVPANPAEDAAAFIDLQGYASFFTDLERAFPTPMMPQTRSMSMSRQPPVRRVLAVHDVGLFEASFVPTQADFTRLDERFRLPEGVWQKLPEYKDWGFAVFQLKPKKGWFGGAKKQTIHPMALSFPRRQPDTIFFPTVHVHDGDLAKLAAFDHVLYAQLDDALEKATPGWTSSFAELGTTVDAARSKGLVDGTRGGWMATLIGTMMNADTWIRPR